MSVEFPYQVIIPDTSPSPVIELLLTNLEKKSEQKITAAVDTGYDGVLVIPTATFTDLRLNIAMVPKNLSAYGLTATGERVEFQSAYALLSILGLVKHLEVEVDSYLENSLPLVGRQLLSAFITTLNGPEEIMELLNK